MKQRLGFTLLELVIVVTLIVLIAVAAFVLVNPLKQIQKGWDGKRKTELGQLQKVLEDWYNDKNCYPRPEQICYDAPVNNACHICGGKPNSPKFSPYLSSLPCDPQSPTKEYLYQVDDITCPTSYKIYAVLSELPQTDKYNYGVSSNNISLEPYPSLGSLTTTPSPTTIPTIITPTPIQTPAPTPTTVIGDYYCQAYNNCTWYDKTLWECTPNYVDPNCGNTNRCRSIKSTCVPR